MATTTSGERTLTRKRPRVASVAALLRKAAQALDEWGWHQGDLDDENGRMCILGAINYAATGDPRDEDGEIVERAREQVHAFLPGEWKIKDPEQALAEWNDTLPEGTTKRKVINLLLRAAEALG